MSDSANRTAASRSSGYALYTSRIASANALSSGARSLGGSLAYRLAIAWMYACSLGLTLAASSTAFWAASYAFGPASSIIGMLMLVPYANARPHWAMAQSGSSFAARSNDRIASGWLNAQHRVR